MSVNLVAVACFKWTHSHRFPFHDNKKLLSWKKKERETGWKAELRWSHDLLARWFFLTDGITIWQVPFGMKHCRCRNDIIFGIFFFFFLLCFFSFCLKTVPVPEVPGSQWKYFRETELPALISFPIYEFHFLFLPPQKQNRSPLNSKARFSPTAAHRYSCVCGCVCLCWPLPSSTGL